MRFVIVTGLSGAGKSQVVKTMEDLGFYCVDNLPPSLLPKFAEILSDNNGKIEKIAIVIDVRGGKLFRDLIPALDWMDKTHMPYEVLFLDADNDVLVKRFKESRRSHPLAPNGRITNGIAEERTLLQDIKERADYLIDTSNLSIKQLKKSISELFAEGKSPEELMITIISFGFKYGLPVDCDLVFDVRFMPNPFYIESMRMLNGKDEPVKNYVLSSEESKIFLQKTMDLISFLLPHYVKEGKTQLVIGIGCTGGKHRSVAISEYMYSKLSEENYKVVIEHRDITKDRKGP